VKLGDEQKPAGSEGPPANPAAETKPAAPKAAPPKPPAVMAATPWESGLVDELKERFGESLLEACSYVGQNFIIAKPDAVISIIECLKFEANFNYLVDLTAVDWPKRAERFDLVYILYSFERNERIRIKTRIADGYRPASAVGVHRTANWLEREVFDLFGIEFEGHPDLRRILMPEDWQGHPLRKDYPVLQQDERWVHENLGIEEGQ
jgi:NADH-quinone oxidoreductase subunit C